MGVSYPLSLFTQGKNSEGGNELPSGVYDCGTGPEVVSDVSFVCVGFEEEEGGEEKRRGKMYGDG